MTCPELNPKSPPLSYSVPSFSAADYDDPAAIVRALGQAGFKVLTLTPTYVLKTSVIGPIRNNPKAFRRIDGIITARTPPIGKMRALAIAGIKAGMHIRVEPHVDADVTLSNTVSYWRAKFAFDPVAPKPDYYNAILLPLFRMIAGLKNVTVDGMPQCKPCFSLTLGSELGASLVGYPAGWTTALQRLHALRAAESMADRLVFGHKINWDLFRPNFVPFWCDQVNAQNIAAGAKPTGLKGATRKPLVLGYLKRLDYVGVSFYPPLAGRIGGTTYPKEKWQRPPTDASVAEMAKVMQRQWSDYLSDLETLGPSVEIAEAGVGTSDATSPNKYDKTSLTPEGKNVVRHVVRGLGKFVRDNVKRFRRKSKTPCMAYSPATYWTTGYYDWLGRNPKWAEAKVDDLKEWAAGYNARTFEGD